MPSLHKQYYVYIVTNEYRTTLYIGVTNNLKRRVNEHYNNSKNNSKTFTGKYNCFYLVYYEVFEDINHAILREKQLKKWRREKKNKLIASFNPSWKTLNEAIL